MEKGEREYFDQYERALVLLIAMQGMEEMLYSEIIPNECPTTGDVALIQKPKLDACIQRLKAAIKLQTQMPKTVHGTSYQRKLNMLMRELNY